MPTPISITGNVIDITGAAQPGIVVTALLVNINGTSPFVNGNQIVAPVKTATSDGGGNFSLTLYGNDVITPSNSYYQFTFKNSAGTNVGELSYQFTGPGPISLSSWEPLSADNNPGPGLLANPIRTFPPNGVGQIIVGDLFVTGTLSAGHITGVIGSQPAYVTTSFNTTPTFTPPAPGQCVFAITLTGDVTSSTINLAGVAAGAFFTWIIIQDATGGRSFTWPPNVFGGSVIDASASPNSVFVQNFAFNGTGVYAISAGNTYQP